VMALHALERSPRPAGFAARHRRPDPQERARRGQPDRRPARRHPHLERQARAVALADRHARGRPRRLRDLRRRFRGQAPAPRPGAARAAPRRPGRRGAPAAGGLEPAQERLQVHADEGEIRS
jgi:hypothetical protein